MSDAWLVTLMVGAVTVAIRAVGPVVLGGRELPRQLTNLFEGLVPALLAAFVVVNTFGDGQALTVDARLAGVVAAAVLIVARAPMLAAVVAAAGATALLRLIV
ncbi:MAG TPA: AzlD domain-containing protein [Tepidiformaceae bacterium]|nr:AzlD domain-containing protein [Tepidiformaceae bacterium]HMO94493.1 AzlD domain-containing protein [Tepidiformaceae bacterium]